MSTVRRVFIGYDAVESDAWHVAAFSLSHHASEPTWITRLDIDALRNAGLYTRGSWVSDGQQYDTVDRKPMSTDFTFSRFLVPALSLYDGWALFCDSDMLFRSDVSDLFALADDRYAVMVVKHDYRPDADRKMRGQLQTKYRRKNWSSVILWNCGHPLNRTLTPEIVNRWPGRDLHGFAWLPDEAIGGLPESWNWLDGHSPLDLTPDLVHFTRGTPNMPQWRDTAFSDEWWTWYGRLPRDGD